MLRCCSMLLRLDPAVIRQYDRKRSNNGCNDEHEVACAQTAGRVRTVSGVAQRSRDASYAHSVTTSNRTDPDGPGGVTVEESSGTDGAVAGWDSSSSLSCTSLSARCVKRMFLGTSAKLIAFE